MRVALIRPTKTIPLLDLVTLGGAMRIRALPSLATGPYAYSLTQEWARAIYEDQPVFRKRIRGVRYTAAHSGGTALALWNTDGDVEVVQGHSHAPQDFAMQDPVLWTRALVAANNIDVNLSRVSSDACDRCP